MFLKTQCCHQQITSRRAILPAYAITRHPPLTLDKCAHLCLRRGELGAPIGLELDLHSLRGVVLCGEGCETEIMMSLCSVVVVKRCLLRDDACC